MVLIWKVAHVQALRAVDAQDAISVETSEAPAAEEPKKEEMSDAPAAVVRDSAPEGPPDSRTTRNGSVYIPVKTREEDRGRAVRLTSWIHNRQEERAAEIDAQAAELEVERKRLDAISKNQLARSAEIEARAAELEAAGERSEAERRADELSPPGP